MLFKCILTESTGNERENTSTWTDIRNFSPHMKKIIKIISVLLAVKKAASYRRKVSDVILKVTDARSKETIRGLKWPMFGPK